MTYLIRKNCEYSIVVEAETGDAALLKAEFIPLDVWDTAWSDLEIDADGGQS